MVNIEKKLVRINVEDLVSYNTVPFNLVDKNGDLIARSGTLLDFTLMGKLSLMELYKFQSTHNIALTLKEPINQAIKSVKEFVVDFEAGKAPPVDKLTEARDKVIGEIAHNINEIDSIDDVRVSSNNYQVSHSINVFTISVIIAMKTCYTDVKKDRDALNNIGLAAMLYDIGMTKIPKEIINKPSLLSSKEWDLVKLHTRIGYKILHENSDLPLAISEVALNHHERMDQSGYPRELGGHEISELTQLISLADVYDAACSDKPYASAKQPKEVIREILTESDLYNTRMLYTLAHMINLNTGKFKESSSDKF